MSERWTLSRAGITNVYQYDDEILHFGGGRLLLRGVNGSGKSTAMNMLLPFLLEADTRRIDAAGEQSGVLRSWMLSGREDAQPVGYLWVEFARGDSHVVCGCGIKANRNTDRVTTWWFVTDLRPGLDFSLVENRIPLSVDSLRSTLGDRAVFKSSERSAYRNELRSRLYGGADIDQHIRLLHVIRNPRVGDRIDLDLPYHLQDALPPLSEPALDDAAQPLEDLEEHRRNVENLTDTSRALSALGDVYRDYVRAELHKEANAARQRADEARRQQAAVDEAHKLVTRAETELADATTQTGRLEAEIGRIEQEADALRASTAYESGQELEALRKQVNELEGDVTRAGATVGRAEDRRQRASVGVQSAQTTLVMDRDDFLAGLGDLGGLASRTGLTVRPPDLPPVPEAGGETPLPTGNWRLQPVRDALRDLRGNVVRRTGEVDGVDAALDRVDQAERDLQLAERDRVREEARLITAADRHNTARRELTDATDQLRASLVGWWDRLTAAAQRHDVSVDSPGEIAPADLVENRETHRQTATQAADTLTGHHHSRIAHLDARADHEREEADRRLQAVDELERLELPVPPALPWQRPGGRLRLAEMIDFVPDLDPDGRLGLEAALEAAGLLGAELTESGSLELETGELITTGGAPAEDPLSELVMVSLPDDAGVEPTLVKAVLSSISTDPTSTAATVISVDGTFRIGALAGRHRKHVVEHVGSGARKAALERRRAEAATLLAEAQASLAATEQQLTEQRRWLAEAQVLRREVPGTAALSDALGAAARAGDDLEECQALVAAAQERERSADTARAAAVDESERRAVESNLPASRQGLAQTRSLLGEATGRADHLIDRVTVLERSHAAWTATADEWREAGAALEVAQAERDDFQSRHEVAAARLATLEDSVGLEYREVLSALEQCDQDKGAAAEDIRESRQRREKALEARATHSQAAREAEERRRGSEAEAVGALRRLRQVLSVPGLADSAADHGLDDLPGVDESSRGLASLAEAVRSATPTPTPESEVTAEGVRISLRRRRDTLGAGWDAEDRQPDPTVPLTVEINGPLGRMSLPAAVQAVESHLQHQAALLTTKQDQALRNLLQGLIAREVSDKLVAARELVKLMNDRLAEVSTSHGVGCQLRWQRRDDLDPHLDTTIDLLGKPPDLRTPEEDDRLIDALSGRIADARTADPELAYRDLVRQVLDYRQWHDMSLYITRAGDPLKKLNRRTPLSEGEKKIVSYLALFAAVAASWDSIASNEPASPRFVLLDDAFAKVSEDNHAQLFGLLVEMDLDFIATSERLWGTHASVPELAITEVVRDAEMGVILLEHARWDGQTLEEAR